MDFYLDKYVGLIYLVNYIRYQCSSNYFNMSFGSAGHSEAHRSPRDQKSNDNGMERVTALVLGTIDRGEQPFHAPPHCPPAQAHTHREVHHRRMLEYR